METDCVLNQLGVSLTRGTITTDASWTWWTWTIQLGTIQLETTPEILLWRWERNKLQHCVSRKYRVGSTMVFLCESLDFSTKKRKSLFLLFLKERLECFALLKSVKEQKSQGAIHSFSSKKGDSHEKIKSKFSYTF